MLHHSRGSPDIAPTYRPRSYPASRSLASSHSVSLKLFSVPQWTRDEEPFGAQAVHLAIRHQTFESPGDRIAG